MLIAFAAIAVASGFAWVAAGIESKFDVAIGGLSSFAVFGFLYVVFDKYLWKVRLIRQWLLVPDLNGKWNCQGETLVKNGETVSWPWTADIIITQSWSAISIVLKRADSSSSRSIAASLYRVHGEGYRLIYHYDNTPEVGQPQLKRHSGQCDLMFNDDVSQASGRYFTDRDRMTIGTMKLTRNEKTT